MIQLPRWAKAVCLLFLLPAINATAQNKAQDHNSSRSNKTASINSSGWTFGAGTGASFGIKPDEKSLFRGNSVATKMFARYSFGTVGLGFNTGIIPGSISSSAVNQFLTDRKFPADALQSVIKPMNAYLLFGPAFSFGNQVKITADINGGIFYNNSGGLSISQQGAARPLYRFDAGTKNLMPGFSGNISIAYPISNTTRFFINTDYLQSSSSIRLFDPQRGIDVATEQNRTTQLFTAGLGIIKSFGTARDQATGMAFGKKHIANVKYQTIARETGSGIATGKRIVAPRDAASSLATGKRNVMQTMSNSQNCGPVTIKTTNADGSSEEQTFACTDDAVNFKRQTQGSSFGEKVNAGLHAAGGALAQGKYLQSQNIIHRDIAARNVLVGCVNWSGASASGIVTNQMAAVSSVSTMAGGSGGGAAAASYARNGVATGAAAGGIRPTGINTAIHAREAGSGMATGRRQYQPVFFEGENVTCNDCMANVISNPLYAGNNNGTQSPLYDDKGREGVNPLYSGNKTASNDVAAMAGLKVYLVDAGTGAAVAVTQTEAGGNFWFANIPSGNYFVKISGSINAKKGYDMYLKNKGSYDVAGEMLMADDFWSVDLQTFEGTPEDAAAVIKTKTKSNQSNDRTAANNNEASMIWSPRSNKTIPVALADIDRDGTSEIVVGGTANGASLLGGALPGGAVISAMMMPGTPIGGIIVKGGKNPGGQMRTTTTNEFGEFEFTGWEEGNYTITADVHYVINDETFVAVGDESSSRISMNVTVPKQTQGTTFGEKVNAGSINNINPNSMPNRISMNVTVPKQTQGATFGEKVNAGKTDDPTTRARNNNTVRSNRTDNAFVIADLDGDGSMESSYLNVNGEVATITIAAPANGKVVEKATSGLKDVIRTQVRMASNVGPVKWMSPEAKLTQVWGDPHVDEKDGTLIIGSNNNQPLSKEQWQSAPVAVKSIRCSDGTCAIITSHPEDFAGAANININNLPGEPVANAAVWFADNKGNVYTVTTNQNGRMSLNGLPTGVPLSMIINMSIDGSDDIIIGFATDAQGSAISNVLKTKHDTAKNSVGNIR